MPSEAIAVSAAAADDGARLASAVDGCAGVGSVLADVFEDAKRAAGVAIFFPDLNENLFLLAPALRALCRRSLYSLICLAYWAWSWSGVEAEASWTSSWRFSISLLRSSSLSRSAGLPVASMDERVELSAEMIFGQHVLRSRVCSSCG